MDFRLVQGMLDKSSNLLLLTHEKPDGDAIGSCLAMADLIIRVGKTARVALVGPCPQHYRFLDPNLLIVDTLLHADPLQIDGIIVLDTGTWNQLGRGAIWLRNYLIPRLIIDHHPTQDDLGGEAIVNTSAEATATIVASCYSFFGMIPSPNAAMGLFTALAFDTGWFRHSNVKAETMHLAGDLISWGADPSLVFKQIYQQDSLKRMHLRARAMASLETYLGGRVGVLKLSHGDFLATGCTLADSEGLSDIPRQLAGVEVALALFEESTGSIRVSLRSSGQADVGSLAELFGGGGHRAASGCKLQKGLGQAESEMLRSINTILSQTEHHQ